MKVLLLNPPFLPKFSRQSRSPCVTKGGTFYIPYFLAYCAGAVEKAGFETKLVDAVANCWDRERTVQFAKEYNPQMIVIDTSTPSIMNDMEVADALKNALPDAHITLVGTHPTALPDETLKKCKADSVCRGEYDYTVRDLAAALKEKKSLKTIEGLSFRYDSKIIHNSQRELIKNLDELPFVSEVFLKHFGKEGIKKYFYASLRWPQTTLLTARGCPYNCLPANTRIAISKNKEITIKDFVENPTKTVSSFNKGKTVKSDVYGTQILESKELIEIKTEDGKKLRLTPDHLVWTKRGWIEAGNLNENDCVLVK